MKLKSTKPNKIVLCQKKNGCCPTILFDQENNVSISDDFGGKVQISAAEFLILGEKLKEIFEEDKA